MRRPLLLLLPVAVVAALGYWVLHTESRRPHPQGDHYVPRYSDGPATVNPFTAQDAVARKAVLELTHDRLLALDEDAELVPALAQRFTGSADGRTFVLELRDGATFADGAPVTMRDVMLPWEIHRAGHALAGPVFGGLALLESAQPLDQRRLQLVLRQRHFAGLGQVATSWIVVQRRWFEAEVARLAAAAQEPVPAGPADPRFAHWLREIKLCGPGTGPYQLGRDARTGEPMWDRNVDLWLTANPGSWRRQAQPECWNLAGIRLLFVRDPAGVRAALRRQEIDFTEDSDAERTLTDDPELAAHYRAHVYSYRTLGPWFVVWNHEHEALRDARVRRALAMLFDRERIALLLAPRAIPPTGWFAAATGRVPADLQPLPHDVDAARALLTESGFGPARPLSLGVLIPDVPDAHAVLDLAMPDFARAGVELRKEPMAFAVFLERRKQREFDAFLYLWNPDPWNDPSEVFHSAQATAAGNNWMHYRSADMDRVLEAACAELDAAKRQRHWAEFCRIFERDQPVTMLYHQRLSALLHRRFQGVEVGTWGLTLKHWWVEPQDQRYR